MEVIVTNTIPLRSEARRCKKVSVLSVGRLLAQAVQSIHEETSVSVLFI
jgi:ribose-phosphate pyrophosphokinase